MSSTASPGLWRAVSAVGVGAVLVASATTGASAAPPDRKIFGPTASYGPYRVVRERAVADNLNFDVVAAPDGTTYSAGVYQGKATVWRYAPGATGDVFGARLTIGGVGIVREIGVDAGKNLYVTTGSETRVYPPGASGDAAPVRRLYGGGRADDLAVRSDGAIAVLSRDPNHATTAVEVYAPGASGDDEPAYDLEGPRTRLGSEDAVSVAWGPRGEIWVRAAGSLLGFAPGAHGNVAPRQIIRGSRTGLEEPLLAEGTVSDTQVDAQGRVYTTSVARAGLFAFAPTAQGNAAPAKVLTTIGRGDEFALLRDGTVVRNANPSQRHLQLAFYRTLFPTRASVVRSLRVTGRATARKRVVRWTKPAADGGRPITGYKVIVRKKHKVVKRVVLGDRRRAYRLKRKHLPRGKLTVTVRARTAVGYGAKSTTTFRVRK